MAKTKTPVTPVGRVSFPHVFKPYAFEEKDEPKFEITLLLPKDSTDVSALKAECEKAVKAKWGDKPPANLRSPIRDGDVDRPDKEEYAGCYFLTLRGKQAPHVSKRNAAGQMEAITAESGDFYAGCWAVASFRAYAYDTKGNRGVAFGLNNVFKVRDDEPFGAPRTSAEDDFGDLDMAAAGDAPAELPF